MQANQRNLETQLEMAKLENKILKSRMQEQGKMAEKTLIEREAKFEQRGRETANAQGVNKEIRNQLNLTDVEEEIDESINHQNQETRNETIKEKARVTKTKLEMPKMKTDIFHDYSEFMRKMDERLQNKINEIQNMLPIEKAIKEAKDMSKSPFIGRVLALPKPKKFHMPQIEQDSCTFSAKL